MPALTKSLICLKVNPFCFHYELGKKQWMFLKLLAIFKHISLNGLKLFLNFLNFQGLLNLKL